VQQYLCVLDLCTRSAALCMSMRSTVRRLGRRLALFGVCFAVASVAGVAGEAGVAAGDDLVRTTPYYSLR
jgi:hypothetical protein